MTIIARHFLLSLLFLILLPTITWASGMTYFPIEPCTVLRTASSGGEFSADESRSFLIRGDSTDLSPQGGSSTGRGVPDEAGAIMVNVVANGSTGNGAVKAWPEGQPEPSKFMNTSTDDSADNGSVVVNLGDPALANDFQVKTFRTGTHLMFIVSGYFLESSNTVKLDGIDISILGLRYAGTEGSSNHGLISKEGYFVGLVSGGSVRGNIIYHQSSDCTCIAAYCDGEAFVSGGQPGWVIRATDRSDPFGANRIFAIPKTATYVTDFSGTALGTGTGSRRVTGSCQSNQSLAEGLPVKINNPITTGIDTASTEPLDPTERHFITFD
ncbi:hypothetical protein [Wenzhouxiangella sp. EGI_FJ10305]|uniref:hypothetical protein n=1 Tax=Wenzhouxiangella sp. EGI_FJ10305 TaxID=3243768 RepID=UPI0035E071FC